MKKIEGQEEITEKMMLKKSKEQKQKKGKRILDFAKKNKK